MPNTHSNKKTGHLGEEIACKYLQTIGYRILAKNYRYSRMAEIDVVAKDGSDIVFVEVKTRNGLGQGHPFEAVNHSKLINIFKAGLFYLENTKEPYERYRIDIISVLLNHSNSDSKIEHLKDISFN